jgi:hypothetical protein
MIRRGDNKIARMRPPPFNNTFCLDQRSCNSARASYLMIKCFHFLSRAHVRASYLAIKCFHFLSHAHACASYPTIKCIRFLSHAHTHASSLAIIRIHFFSRVYTQECIFSCDHTYASSLVTTETLLITQSPDSPFNAIFTVSRLSHYKGLSGDTQNSSPREM